MPPLFLYLFGTPRLLDGGRFVSLDTRKALALLAYLAVTNQPQTRDTLAGLLWPEYDQSHARGALRRTLSTLQNAVAFPVLDANRDLIALSPVHPLWVDVKEFRRLHASTDPHSHRAFHTCPECSQNLEEAVALYTGDFLAGFTLRDSVLFDDWQFYQSEGLRRELAEILEKLVNANNAIEKYGKAIQYAHRWLALDPLREEAHRALMEAYARSGQRNTALRQYRECVRVLDQELGVPPLEETSRLYDLILTNTLPFISQSPSASQVEVSQSPVSATIFRPTISQQVPLVGRVTQLSTLLSAYQDQRDKRHFFILEGEAGIGKTRLVEEFLSLIQPKGACILGARCYEGEKELAYSPFIEAFKAALGEPAAFRRLGGLSKTWLTELSRLLPQITQLIPDLPPAPHTTNPAASSIFMESLLQVMLTFLQGEPPGVLYLDDLQWADEASLEFLLYLIRHSQAQPIFILATWQSEGTLMGHHLSQLASEIRRYIDTSVISLPRLTRSEVDDLLGTLPSSSSFSSSLGDRLYHESEGVPIFLVSYLDDFVKRHATGEFPDSNNIESLPLPSNARDLLYARLRGVSETGSQLLAAAAVIGRSFDFETLCHVSGRSDVEATAGLDSLLESGLIVERTDISSTLRIQYDFSHERLRSLVYDETSLTRRRLLHRRTAEALINQSRPERPSGMSTSKIAVHLQAAGQNDLAAEYYRQAGEYAQGLYAFREAIGHFQAALAIGYSLPADLHEAIGDAFTYLGEYNSSQAAYEAAAAQCSPQASARLEYKLGDLCHRRGDWNLAICHFQAALDLLSSSDDAPLRSRLYADWSRSALQLGNTSQALDLAQRALQLAEQARDEDSLAQAHNILGMLMHRQGDSVQAVKHLERSLALAEKTANLSSQVAALNNLALVHSKNEDLLPALDYTKKALALCVQIGDRHRQAALHNNLADLYHQIGDEDQAMLQLRNAVVIFHEIGSEVGELQPEIWKLTQW